MLSTAVKIAAVALFGFVVWRMFRPRHAVRITLNGDGVLSHDGLPKAKVPDVVQHFEKHIPVVGKVAVFATRERNGYLRVRFRGKLAAGTQQQIRNFLNTIL